MKTLLNLNPSIALLRHLIRRGLVLAFTLLVISCQKAVEKKPSNNQNVVPAETQNRLRAIYERGEFIANSFQAVWNQDGSAYLVLENVYGKNVQELVSYSTSSGKRSVLISASQLVQPGTKEAAFSGVARRAAKMKTQI